MHDQWMISIKVLGVRNKQRKVKYVHIVILSDMATVFCYKFNKPSRNYNRYQKR